MKIWKIVKKVMTWSIAIILVLTVCSCGEIIWNAYKNYKQYPDGGEFINYIDAATIMWQWRLEEVEENFDKWLNNINKKKGDNVIEYPMANWNISWNTLNRP